MITENKCDKCGTQLQSGTSFCTSCGNKIVSDNSYFNDQEATYHEEDQQKNSKKGKLRSIIISVISIAVASTVGEFAGKHLVGNFSENNQSKKIDTYIENMKDYEPGRSTKNRFVSEHFEFQFNSNENWVMYTDEELEPLTEQIKQTTISSGIATMKSEGISKKLQDKWIDSVYVKTEMGASYFVDDMPVGEVTVGVFGAYGADDISIDEFTDSMKSEILKTAYNVESGKRVIAGNTYNSINATIKIDGVTLLSENFIRIDDGMVCMISCKAHEDYKDTMMDSFMEQISEYD